MLNEVKSEPGEADRVDGRAVLSCENVDGIRGLSAKKGHEQFQEFTLACVWRL